MMINKNNVLREDKMKLTKKEMNFLIEITNDDYCDWGIYNGTSGVGTWVCEPSYNMKVTRGLITSLNKKGVLDLGENQKGFDGQDMLWVSINPEYLDFDNYKLKGMA
jgi:hypothetical protein